MSERHLHPRRSAGRSGIAVGAVLIAFLGACGSSSDDQSTETTQPASPSESAAPPETAAAISPASSGDTAFECPEQAPIDGLQPIAAGTRLRVSSTVAPITSMAANIAGESADVVGLVPEGTNSHTYEPTPSAAVAVSTANLVFINGMKLEEPTRDLAEANLKDGAAIVSLGDRTIPESDWIYDFSFPKDGGKPNPHLWTNPPMAACYARIMAMAMSEADPANASVYGTNAAAYEAKLVDLDARFRTATETVPANNRKLLTYHDAYAYFAKRYGWEVIGAVQVSDFEDPTPKEVAKLIEQVEKAGVPAIFGSEVFPSPVLEQIGNEANVGYVDVLRDDDLPGTPGDSEHSFLGLMQFDYRTMVSALGGDPAVLDAFDASNVAPDKADYPQ
jgi:ABC-type Zn uptake system ZnuABC Zn-binding protein ZnuA